LIKPTDMGSTGRVDELAVAAIAALDDDVRRALYQYVRAARAPVTREDAAAAVNISRKLAAFHLDKLVDAGLLHSGFDPAAPRRVGRAPRTYEPVADTVAVSVPERSPDLLAAILLEAATGPDGPESMEQGALRAGRERGRAVGRAERARRRTGRLGAERALGVVHEVVAGLGYEPYRGADGAVRLRNCPFHPLAASAPAFVCGINRAYLAGLVEGVGAGERLDAVLAPAAGECCVELRRTP
jgi:predicted ArsR family transcriptional regulator